MKPKKNWANFGVEDIERTQEFYQSMGFRLNGKPAKDLVNFFFSDDDFIIDIRCEDFSAFSQHVFFATAALKEYICVKAWPR